MQCKICKGEVDASEATGLVLSRGNIGERIVFGLYHYQCLIRKLKSLIEKD